MNIQTADLCDAHEDKLAVVAPMFASYGGASLWRADVDAEDLRRQLLRAQGGGEPGEGRACW